MSTVFTGASQQELEKRLEERRRETIGDIRVRLDVRRARQEQLCQKLLWSVTRKTCWTDGLARVILYACRENGLSFMRIWHPYDSRVLNLDTNWPTWDVAIGVIEGAGLRYDPRLVTAEAGLVARWS